MHFSKDIFVHPHIHTHYIYIYVWAWYIYVYFYCYFWANPYTYVRITLHLTCAYVSFDVYKRMCCAILFLVTYWPNSMLIASYRNDPCSILTSECALLMSSRNAMERTSSAFLHSLMFSRSRHDDILWKNFPSSKITIPLYIYIFICRNNSRL